MKCPWCEFEYYPDKGAQGHYCPNQPFVIDLVEIYKYIKKHLIKEYKPEQPLKKT